MVPHMQTQRAKDQAVELIVHVLVCTLSLAIKVRLLYLMSSKREIYSETDFFQQAA